jgi:hypothetical protein
MVELTECITGGSGYSTTPSIGIYRSGPDIVRFFKSLGYDDFQLSGSRVPSTEEFIENIAKREDGYERIVRITERLLDPRDYIGKEDKLKAVINHLNRVLQFDGLEIIRRGQVYTIGSSSTAAPVSDLYKEQILALSLEHCRQDYERALKNVDEDPSGAIASACSIVESTAKAILDKLGKSYPKDQSIQSLVTAVTKELNLAPDQHAEAEVKRVLGGLINVAAGIGVLRTKYSSAHGHGGSQLGLSSVHARLAVNSASTVGLFLLEIYLSTYRS